VNTISKFNKSSLAVIAMMMCFGGKALATDPNYPSDNQKLDGDTFWARVDIPGFKNLSDPNDTTEYNAPQNCKLTVYKDDGKTLSVRFTKLKTKSDGSLISDIKNPIVLNKQYTIERNTFLRYDCGHSGVTFGGLVVPFKFYLSGDNKIAASSTVAPYIGYSNYSTVPGLIVTPIFSAGLGLVSVANPTSNATETKPAFSTALGFKVTSIKNQNFNAGILVGKDFLSKADRDNDPVVSKLWLSFYVGYTIGE
jgi:hypothetical protein